MPFCNPYSEILEVFGRAEIANYSSDELAEYQQSLKVYRDLKNVIGTAYEEGKGEGLVLGREEGKQEGLAKGREEGGLEANLRTARNLKLLGISIAIIAQSTGLSEEEIGQF
ncbi:MAG: hypothetical protein MUC97_13380 [Bernardetiaceae bacterium]|jgi:predicted transposase/invertase (TIGR01784 family)|nr:hypothetical protein [Bernardetiaceae bacterium]